MASWRWCTVHNMTLTTRPLPCSDDVPGKSFVQSLCLHWHCRWPCTTWRWHTMDKWWMTVTMMTWRWHMMDDHHDDNDTSMHDTQHDDNAMMQMASAMASRQWQRWHTTHDRRHVETSMHHAPCTTSASGQNLWKYLTNLTVWSGLTPT